MRIGNWQFAIVIASLLAVGNAHAAPAPATMSAPKARPNVLFIICDDLNTQALSCYGSTVSKTPNIDRLAARPGAVRFERAYCQYPLCWPSRHSFLSGRRPDARFIGAANFRQRVPDVTFFPEHFRNNGYFTARVGKIFHCRTVFNGMTSYEDENCWDLSELGGTEFDPCGYAVTFANHPRGQAAHPELKKHIVRSEVLNPVSVPAADYWMDMTAVDLPDDQMTDGVIASRVAQLLEQHAGGRATRGVAAKGDDTPFFIAAGFRRPHLLWVAPEKYFNQYPWQSIELPKEPADDVRDIPKAALTRGSPAMSDEQRKKAIAAYYACVAMVDANVGRLLDQMDSLKLWDNTIVIFTSDHGWHLNQHGGLWGKVTLFEESAKVPLIIVVPSNSRDATASRVLPREEENAPPRIRSTYEKNDAQSRIATNDEKKDAPSRVISLDAKDAQRGVAAATVCLRTVEMLDLYPTLCELAGLPAPENAKLDGISLVPQLKDPQAPRAGDKPAYSVLRRGKIWGKSVYTERYRYAEYGDSGSAGVELYDHETDPKEFTNLATDQQHAATAKRFKSLLDQEIKLRDTDGAGEPTGD
ncbi:MAG: iduronate 2-sulfatase [Phycisphaerales bacterium]|nr:iduronate 2-sulfatase [Phycisphaerales bacterium]